MLKGCFTKYNLVTYYFRFYSMHVKMTNTICHIALFHATIGFYFHMI